MSKPMPKSNFVFLCNIVFASLNIFFSTQIFTDGMSLNHLKNLKSESAEVSESAENNDIHSDNRDAKNSSQRYRRKGDDDFGQFDVDEQDWEYLFVDSEAVLLESRMFNREKRTPAETGYFNRTEAESLCEAAHPCYASDNVLPTCANDETTYLNPGVFLCVQKCKPGLKPEHLGPCEGYEMPTTTSTTPKPTVITTPKHKTVEGRIRVKGFIRKILDWFGLHTHKDGGIYLFDEKIHNTWWNP